MIWLLVSGWFQVTLVSLNTYQVSHKKYLAAFPVGFLISWVWAHNVHHLAFGTEWHMVSYALGASLGTVTGMWLGQKIHA